MEDVNKVELTKAVKAIHHYAEKCQKLFSTKEEENFSITVNYKKRIEELEELVTRCREEEAAKLKVVEEKLADEVKKAKETMEKENAALQDFEKRIRLLETENLALKKKDFESLKTVSLLENRNCSLEKETAELKTRNLNLTNQLQEMKMGFNKTNESIRRDSVVGMELVPVEVDVENGQQNQISVVAPSKVRQSGTGGRPSDSPIDNGGARKVERRSSSEGVSRRRKRERLAPDYQHREADRGYDRNGHPLFICSCKLDFDTEDGLKNHINYYMKRHYGCTLCSDSFHPSLSHLKNHLRTYHKKSLDEHDEQTGCITCSKGYATREEYIAHYRKNHFSEEPERGYCRPHPAEMYLRKLRG